MTTMYIHIYIMFALHKLLVNKSIDCYGFLIREERIDSTKLFPFLDDLTLLYGKWDNCERMQKSLMKKGAVLYKMRISSSRYFANFSGTLVLRVQMNLTRAGTFWAFSNAIFAFILTAFKATSVPITHGILAHPGCAYITVFWWLKVNSTTSNMTAEKDTKLPLLYLQTKKWKAFSVLMTENPHVFILVIYFHRSPEQTDIITVYNEMTNKAKVCIRGHP